MNQGAIQPGPGDERVDGQSSETTEELGGELTRDEVFEVLSNRRRRYVLHYLQQNGERASLSDVAEQVAAWENDTEIEAISSDERKSAYTSLRQFHLPKMAEKAVVEFDPRAGIVELSDAAGDLDVYLEVVSGREIPWSLYFVGLSTLGICLAAAVGLGAWPISLLPAASWLAFLATMFAVSSLVYAYYSHRRMRIGNQGPPPEIED